MVNKAFLHLIRLGVGHRVDALPQNIDWGTLEALAERHGLSAVLVDGIEKLPEDKRPPKQVLLQWIGETLQGFEYRYELYRRAISEMAAFYNAHGFRMMVLKGYACSLNWPKPEHRPCGDIDIWLFGEQKEADALLEKEKDIKIDKSHHHHTVFYWRDFMVENHYDFINTYRGKSSVELEKIFKDLGKDDSHFVELYGERVYMPSPSLHALFLIRHAMNHFTSSEITIRQLIDWGFFVKAHGTEVDWNWLEAILERFGMKPLYGIFNAICVEDLGFDVCYFNWVQFNPFDKDRVLKEIIAPEYPNEFSKNIFVRMVYKYRRWKANEWKRALFSDESNFSLFWSGIKAHILKPSSI